MYPDAVKMRTCDTMQIAEGMVEIFSRHGVRQETLSDKASTFTSNVMREVGRLLSMKQLMTTPYHTIYNELVKNFSGKIMQMIRKVHQEHPVDWDQYLPAVLFAYREVTQGYLGFYPFYVLYRCAIRGSLAILKER